MTQAGTATEPQLGTLVDEAGTPAGTPAEQTTGLEEQDLRATKAPTPLDSARSFARAPCTTRTQNTASRLGGSVKDSLPQPPIVPLPWVAENLAANAPDLVELGPSLAASQPMLAEFGQSRPGVGQIRTKFDQTRPNLVGSFVEAGRLRAKFGQLRVRLGRV